MFRIGYLRLPGAALASETAALKAIGCQVVRADERVGPSANQYPVLTSTLVFIGKGDELVVPRLTHLGASSRLEHRKASLFVMEPQLCTRGRGGRALHAVLEAVSAAESSGLERRPPAAIHEIRELKRAGFGPVQIARRLGVSRMTVWRKLRAGEASPLHIKGDLASGDR
jgi:DNA invertase Pin-like site-specific DNA recombinase